MFCDTLFKIIFLVDVFSELVVFLFINFMVAIDLRSKRILLNFPSFILYTQVVNLYELIYFCCRKLYPFLEGKTVGSE